MKVMRVITRFNIGGPALHAAILNQGLENGQTQSILVTGQTGEREGDMSYLLPEKETSRYVIPELRREIHPVRDLLSLWKLFRLMRTERPDIVHTHMAKAGTLGRLAAVLAGVPVRIHTFHGHVLQGYFGSLSSRIFLMVERFLARRTTCLIAVSEQVRTELEDRYRIASGGKIRTIPIGLALEPFLQVNGRERTLLAELGLPSDVRLIGIVGRLAPVKNHTFFLRLAEGLVKRRRNLHFVVVGRGEEEERLKRLVRERTLSKVIHFLGWRKDLPGIYAGLDLVVLTSQNEGTPVSLIEAMASGKAVVATRVGGVADVVRDGITGFTVPFGDLSLFAERALRLLDDPDLLRRFGEAGRGWVRQRFEKETLLRNIRQLYEELLSEHKGAAK